MIDLPVPFCYPLNMAKIEGAIEGYTLVAKPSRKGQPLPHLKKQQERFAQARREAAEETKDLQGAARVNKMIELTRQKLAAYKQ